MSPQTNRVIPLLSLQMRKDSLPHPLASCSMWWVIRPGKYVPMRSISWNFLLILAKELLETRAMSRLQPEKASPVLMTTFSENERGPCLKMEWELQKGTGRRAPAARARSVRSTNSLTISMNQNRLSIRCIFIQISLVALILAPQMLECFKLVIIYMSLNEDPNPSAFLYSSSQLFNTARLALRTRTMQEEKHLKSQFEKQFALDKSVEVQDIDLPKQAPKPTFQFSKDTIDKLIYQLSNLKQKISEGEQIESKMRMSCVGEDEESFLRKLLFQQGLLDWDQRLLDLPRLLNAIKCKRNHNKDKKPKNPTKRTEESEEDKSKKEQRKNQPSEVPTKHVGKQKEITNKNNLAQANQAVFNRYQMLEHESEEDSNQFINKQPHKAIQRRSTSLKRNSKALPEPTHRRAGTKIEDMFKNIRLPTFEDNREPSGKAKLLKKPHIETGNPKVKLCIEKVGESYLEGFLGPLELTVEFECIRGVQIFSDGLCLRTQFCGKLILHFREMGLEDLFMDSLVRWLKRETKR